MELVEADMREGPALVADTAAGAADAASGRDFAEDAF
jgi:hypothetical protein